MERPSAGVASSAEAAPPRSVWSQWVDRWETPGAVLSALRVVYAVGMLVVWPPLDSRPLAGLPDGLWFAPLGPFAFLPGYPPVGVLTAAELLARALLVLLAFGIATRWVSLGYAIVATLLAGIRFSTAKIDHDILLFTVLPAVMAFSAWGTRYSVDAWWRGRRGTTPRDPGSALPVALLALATGVEFFTSGIVKALTGWLDPSGSAVRAWVAQYVFALNPTPVSTRAIGVAAPLAWEVADVLSVLFEIGFLVAIATRQWTRLYVVAACVFHVGILALLGIDFAKLALVYLVLLAPSGRDAVDAERVRRVPRWAPPIVGATATVLVIAVPALWVGGLLGDLPGLATRFGARAPFTFGLPVLVVVAIVAALAWWRGRGRERRVRPGDLAPAGVALAPITLGVALTFVVSEPYPAVMGPLFWGDRSSGAGSTIVVAAIEHDGADGARALGPGELYGVAEPYATNLLTAQFPGAGPEPGVADVELLGHAFLPYDDARPRGVVDPAVCTRFLEYAGEGHIEVVWRAITYDRHDVVDSRDVARYRFALGENACGETQVADVILR